MIDAETAREDEGSGLAVAARKVVEKIDEVLADEERVMGRLDTTTGDVPIADREVADLRERSPGLLHRAQLRGVLDRAQRQAGVIGAEGIGIADPDLALWQLSRPGYLREIADRPVTSSLSALFLVPVGLTWLVLGIFEARYAASYDGTDVKQRPPFFADWIAGPWYGGPWVLSFAIVITIAGLAWLALRSNSAQRRVDEFDDMVRSWEIALHTPVEQLRELVAAQRVRQRPDEAMVRAATGMERAADRTAEAAQSLGQTKPLIANLGENLKALSAVIAELKAATPELAEQVTALREVDASIRNSATETRASLMAAVEQTDQRVRAAAERTEEQLNTSAIRTAGVLEGAAQSTAAALGAAATGAAAALGLAAAETASALTAATQQTTTQITAATERADGSLRSATTVSEEALRRASTEAGEVLRSTADHTAAALSGAADDAGATMSSTAAAVAASLTASVDRLDGRLREVSTSVERTLRTTTDEIVTEAAPLTGVIRDTSEIARTVQQILDELSCRVSESRTITDQAESFREALKETGKPFGAATETLGTAAKTLDSVTKSLDQTATQLMVNIERAQALIDQVDTFVMTVDGIRIDAHEHNGRLGQGL